MDMLKDHVGQCDGSPKNSQCQLFACKKEWFVWCTENWRMGKQMPVADSSGVSEEPENAPNSKQKSGLHVSGEISAPHYTPCGRNYISEEEVDESNILIKTEVPDSVTDSINGHNLPAPMNSKNSNNHQNQTMPVLHKQSRPASVEDRTVLSALGRLVKKVPAQGKSSSLVRGASSEKLPLNLAGKHLIAGLLPKGRLPVATSTSADMPQSSTHEDSICIDISDDEEDENSTDAYSEAEKMIEPAVVHTESEQLAFPHESRLTLMTRAGKPFYKCIECNQGSGNRAKMEKHLTAHDMGTLLSCRFCNYNTISRGTLVQHERKHTSAECDICSMKFKSQYLLKKHIGMSHTDSLPPDTAIQRSKPQPKSGGRRKRKIDYIEEDAEEVGEPLSTHYMGDRYGRLRAEEENVEEEEEYNQCPIYEDDEDEDLPNIPYGQEIKSE